MRNEVAEIVQFPVVNVYFSKLYKILLEETNITFDTPNIRFNALRANFAKLTEVDTNLAMHYTQLLLVIDQYIEYLKEDIFSDKEGYNVMINFFAVWSDMAELHGEPIISPVTDYLNARPGKPLKSNK